MKFTKLILSVGLAAAVCSCMPEDPHDIVSPERAIQAFRIEGLQVGPAEIHRGVNKSTLDIYLVEGTDLSAVKPVIRLSKGASSIPASGEVIDLSSKKFTYQVTAANGQNREWEVDVKTFSNALEGKWVMASPVKTNYYIGEGESWGWKGTKDLAGDLPGFAAANDNVLTFKTTGVNKDGNVYGTGTYEAGNDGKFETFVYPNNGDSPIDYSKYFGKLPQGKFDWVNDLNNHQIVFSVNGKVVKTLPVEWKNEEKTAFDMSFKPEAIELGWSDDPKQQELNYTKAYTYPMIREGVTIAKKEVQMVIPGVAPIELNGKWGIKEIGFWPAADNKIGSDMDNFLEFSHQQYDANTGVISGDFIYNAGKDGQLSDAKEDAWKVFPAKGTFKLTVKKNPEDPESRKAWSMSFFDAAGKEMKVDNPVEGKDADHITLKFNGGKDLATGADTDAHWFKFERGFIGVNPNAGAKAGFGDFISGTWGKSTDSGFLSYYDGGHKQYPGAEADNDNSVTFKNVVTDQNLLKGDFEVAQGADKASFEIPGFTLKSGTFVFTADKKGSSGEEYGKLSITAADGTTQEFKTVNWYGDFQVKFQDPNGQGEIYYRLKKQ
ncbi:hypothetical protein [Persicobacter psychrovividus]|uniref:Uncharacterized protein n=1 Tax=Persicobacter psychrovividus TaxID=387638 RepID=A0ABN6LG87_9BACT|nr:hypothetical protein PEPS_44480 [Persicobacter psychrovividus]